MAGLLVPTSIGEQEASKIEATPHVPSRSLRTGVATAILALSVAFGGSASAQTTPPTNQIASAASASPAAKGGGQVVNIDGKEYTFYDISKMDSGERRKNGIFGKLKALGQLEAYQEWSSQHVEAANQEERKLDGNIETANQRIEVKKGVEQAANQEERKLDGNIEAANQTEAKIDKELIGIYSQLIANAEKGAPIEKSTLEDIIKNPITPAHVRNRAAILLLGRA